MLMSFIFLINQYSTKEEICICSWPGGSNRVPDDNYEVQDGKVTFSSSAHRLCFVEVNRYNTEEEICICFWPGGSNHLASNRLRDGIFEVSDDPGR